MKAFYRLLVLVLVTTFLTACGGDVASTATPVASGANQPSATASASGGPVTELTLLQNGAAVELPGWTAAVDAANKLLAPKNIHIKIQPVQAQTWDDYYQKVIAMAAAGQSADLGHPAESLIRQFEAKGQLDDISDVVQSLDKSQYFDKAFQGVSVQNGKSYSVPSGVYHMLMYYNKNLFDKAGLPYPSSDWNNSITYDQVISAAQKLTTGSGATKQFGFYAGPYLAFIGMFSLSLGGKNVFNDDGSCSLTDDAALKVYNWFDTLLKNGSMPRPSDTKILSPEDMFKAGRLAMFVDGTWYHSVPRSQITTFKTGIAAIPSGDGKSYGDQYVDQWVVWKNTPHPKEAHEALAALISPEAIDATAKLGIGGSPVNKTVLNNLQDQLIGTQFTADDKRAFIDGLDHTISVPYSEHYQEADSKVTQMLDQWLLGQISSQQYAKQVCDAVNSAIKQ